MRFDQCGAIVNVDAIRWFREREARSLSVSSLCPRASGIPPPYQDRRVVPYLGGRVVLYTNQMTWIAGTEPISAFDDNGNGRIDLTSVVRLFNHF